VCERARKIGEKGECQTLPQADIEREREREREEGRER
jgi:hypothetical protein